MSWINLKKEYDMVPPNWITKCLKIYKIRDEVILFIKMTMETWRVELIAGGKSLAEVRSREAYSREMHDHNYYL